MRRFSSSISTLVLVCFVIFAGCQNAAANAMQLASNTATETAAFIPAPANTPTNLLEPEIVRLSYVQGDVRFSQGGKKGPDLSKSWDLAIANLAISEGDSIATGNGRVEIEFEYGSIVYLAENSVLLFKKLSDRDSLPTTDIELVAGTATFVVMPIPKEIFSVVTPSNHMQFSSTSYLRVDSYLDTTVMTAQGGGGLNLRDLQAQSNRLAAKQGIALRDGVRVPLPAQSNSSTRPDWDSWVDVRVQQKWRDDLAGIKASGLNTYIPGVADLYTAGTFFPCAPYGTCWEPKGLDEATPDSASLQPAAFGHASSGARFQLASMLFDAQQSGPAISPMQQGPLTPIAGLKPKISDYYYPVGFCPTAEEHVVKATDPVTGKTTILQRTLEDDPLWPWALCHAGAWVHIPGRRTRYTFVMMRKHHHPPVHWMRTHKGIMYVPRHPSDVKGKPPLNLKYGVFQPKEGHNGHFELANFKPADRYKVLDEAPKDFRNLNRSELSHAEHPEISAHLLSGGERGAHIAYDYKTRNFLRTGTPGTGRTTGRPVVVGGLSQHGGYSNGDSRGFNGGSGNSGGARGGTGGSSGGSRGGNSGGGGGFHGGGGGGGFHGGGGGGGGGGSHGGGGGGGGGGHH